MCIRDRHHIVDYRVVVDESDGERPPFLEIQQHVHITFTAADEVQLLAAGIQPSVGVCCRGFFQMVKAPAVSYTPLDVYKRQASVRR